MAEDGSRAALEWELALELAAATSGCIALVGGADTGKTTFALELANRAAAAGRRLALLDADVGQAEVGPPACVSLAWVEKPLASLTDLRARALHFVGDISPVGHLLPIVVGTLALARHARERGAEQLVLDTSGLVTGRAAEKLKLAKLSAADPDLVLLFEREAELARLRQLLGEGERPRVEAVVLPTGLRAKSAVFRRSRRQRQWARYFARATQHDLLARQAVVVDAWPFNGTPLPAHHLRFATEALGTEAVYGEESEEALAFCTTGWANPAGFAVIREQFRRRRILATPGEWFQHLLVGLVDAQARTVGLGLLQGIHFGRGLLSLLSPVASVSQVRQVWMGRVRLRPDGTELGRLRPGDL